MIHSLDKIGVFVVIYLKKLTMPLSFVYAIKSDRVKNCCSRYKICTIMPLLVKRAENDRSFSTHTESAQ